MKKMDFLLIVVAGSLLLGCHKDPLPPQNSSQASVPAPHLSDQVAQRSQLGDLEMKDDPPVVVECELMPLPGYETHRRYFTVDLNSDGRAEYFIENYAGAHSMSFAVVDASGKLLTRKRDIGEIGGDRLLVMNSRHHGYCDLICSDYGCGTIMGSMWEFNGRWYVRKREFKYASATGSKGFVENDAGKVRGRWYADVFALPPGTDGMEPKSPKPATSPAQPQAAKTSPFGGEIHAAAECGDLEKVKALLKDNPALVFSKGCEGSTPLYWAVMRGHKDVAEFLLANKADVNAKNERGNTPLHAAALEGHSDVTELLLAHNAYVNAKNKYGALPLHWAAHLIHKDVAELLLANGAKVNAKDQNGQTPLHWVGTYGPKDMVELFLAHKADVNVKDNKGWTPLYCAAMMGHKDMAELLLANNAHVNARDSEGKTPLHMAAYFSHKDVAEFLHQHGGQE
jgi:ankyrin repeat protein